MSFFRALKAGLLIGIGFQGLRLIVTLLITTLQPVVKSYADLGQGYDIIDMGWQTLAAAAWMSPFAALVVPLGIALNLILIRMKLTDTLNVDLWNFWHIIFGGTLVYVLTNSYIAGLTFAMFLVILSLKLADWLAPRWQEYFGLPGTTCSTIFHLTTLTPFAWVTNKIIDCIPGIRDWDVSLQKIQQKYGMIGDNAVLGLVAGCLLAIMAQQPLTIILQVGMGVSAAMILLPKMVSLLMEGLTPIAKAAREIMESKLGGRKFNIGMDVALALGDSTVITGAILMVPITVAIAILMPGNRFFPLAGLASLPYRTSLVAMWSNGNLFRTLVGTTVVMIYEVAALNYMADICTQVVNWSGVKTTGLVVGGSLDALMNFIVVVFAKMVGA
jgi:PTS system galactitol-specific IIC component